jgi:hypothetical protein
MVYVLPGETIDADDQEDMPEDAADDGDCEKGSASVGPSAELRLRDTSGRTADAPPNTQPKDQYRQEAACRSDDLRLERARKTCPIHSGNLEYILQ